MKKSLAFLKECFFPRKWECSYTCNRRFQKGGSFPTQVGVFPLEKELLEYIRSFSHTSGSVPSQWQPSWSSAAFSHTSGSVPTRAFDGVF